MRRVGARDFAVELPAPLEVTVDRERARFSAWYELFPRSASDSLARHGTFADVERRLPYVASMGFDVLYLPPIHPIGRAHRKGPNNAAASRDGDLGSPWAIGAAEGGHTAIHPALGSFADFDHLVEAAKACGLEIALDLAFQCAPDHPWVREHPEWFRHRPDGTIQYAENPPKRYQDIYPLEFEGEEWAALWDALLDVVRFWIGHGVRIFRVDNPHTKPLVFWEWLIAEVKAEHPETIFLAEAFTRPKVMNRLAKAGFTQSYTYFTWRNTADELREYVTRADDDGRARVLPPELLAEHAGHPARAPADRRARDVRLAARPRRDAVVELRHLRPRVRARRAPRPAPGRRGVPRLREVRAARLEPRRSRQPAPPDRARQRCAQGQPRPAADEPGALPRDGQPCADRLPQARRRRGDNVIVCVVSLDPHHKQTAWIELPLDALGLEEGRAFQVHDLLGGARYVWYGARNYVELDPFVVPAHIFRVRRRVRTEHDFDYFL